VFLLPREARRGRPRGSLPWSLHDTASALSGTLTPRTRPSLEQRPARCWPREPVHPPGTEHPPRAILAAHEVKHLDLLVDNRALDWVECEWWTPVEAPPVLRHVLQSLAFFSGPIESVL
jgi:hypothetical protein